MAEQQWQDWKRLHDKDQGTIADLRRQLAEAEGRAHVLYQQLTAAESHVAEWQVRATSALARVAELEAKQQEQAEQETQAAVAEAVRTYEAERGDLQRRLAQAMAALEELSRLAHEALTPGSFPPQWREEFVATDPRFVGWRAIADMVDARLAALTAASAPASEEGS